MIVESRSRGIVYTVEERRGDSTYIILYCTSQHTSASNTAALDSKIVQLITGMFQCIRITSRSDCRRLKMSFVLEICT